MHLCKFFCFLFFFPEENYVFMTFGNYVDSQLSFELRYVHSGYKYYGMDQSIS